MYTYCYTVKFIHKLSIIQPLLTYLHIKPVLRPGLPPRYGLLRNSTSRLRSGTFSSISERTLIIPNPFCGWNSSPLPFSLFFSGIHPIHKVYMIKSYMKHPTSLARLILSWTISISWCTNGSPMTGFPSRPVIFTANLSLTTVQNSLRLLPV